MSLIGTAIGALAPFLPRPVKPVQIPVDSEVERLRCENERLTRSHARLVDHIETLEREILLEQHICAHWKEEAERLAKHSIAVREARERRDINGRTAMAYAQEQQFACQQQALMGRQQAQLAQYAGQAQGLQGAFEGFCNCVPSRAQVWGARREG